MADLPKFGATTTEEEEAERVMAGEDQDFALGQTQSNLATSQFGGTEIEIPDRPKILPRPRPPAPRPRVTYKSGIEWRYFVPISTVFGFIGAFVLVITIKMYQDYMGKGSSTDLKCWVSSKGPSNTSG